MSNIAQVGERLVQAQPRELAVDNMVRRVLGLIQEEVNEDRHEGASVFGSPDGTPRSSQINAAVEAITEHTYTKQDSAGDYLSSNAKPTRPLPMASFSSANVPKSLFHLLSLTTPTDEPPTTPSPFPSQSGMSTPAWGQASSAQVRELREEIIDGIKEIQEEIAAADDQIAGVADVHILPQDNVLVYRPTPTTERFILAAARRRRFSVFIVNDPAQSNTSEPTHLAVFKRKLAAASIPTVTIMNSGLMAYMPRISKVILSARSIVASGDVVAESGSLSLARAATTSSKPVIVLSPVYKLSPQLPTESDLIEWGDPSTYVSFADGPMVAGVKVKNIVTEVIPHAWVSMFVTNLWVSGSFFRLCTVANSHRGSHSRDEVSNIIKDHYKLADAEVVV